MSRRSPRVGWACLSVAILAWPPVVLSEEASAARASTPAAAETGGSAASGASESARPIGLAIDLGFGTTYAFRGLNMFQGASQMDQHGLVSLGIAWAAFETGVTIGYWSAYQVYGDNIGELIDDAVGCEQDLFASYELDLVEDVVTGALSLYWYFYPFADEQATGSVLPSWLEPSATLTVSTVVDLSFQVAYMAALHERWWYVYLHPSVSRELELHPMLTLGLGLTYGYKIFSDPLVDVDNVHDVGLDIGLTVTPLDWLSVRPAVHAAWSNFAGRGFGDEAMVWADLVVGVSL